MRRLVLAALAVVLVPLVGCSDEEPKAEPAPEPSVTESVVPKEETAEEFIRRWLALQRDFQNSGDGNALLEVSERCVACVDAIERISGYYEAGGYVRAGREEIVSIRVRAKTPSIFDVKTTLEPSEFKESEGAPVQRLDGGREHYVLTLAEGTAGWGVVNLMRGTG